MVIHISHLKHRQERASVGGSMGRKWREGRRSVLRPLLGIFLAQVCPAHGVTRLLPPKHSGSGGSRRALLQNLGPALVGLAGVRPASAFENRLPVDEMELKYKTPRTKGPKPTDLGPRAGGGLKGCIDGKPHCFSTSAVTFDDSDLYEADSGPPEEWLVPPFTYQKPLAEAVADLRASIDAYPPGQSGIDGGGYQTVGDQVSEAGAYIYVQFESRRKGYVDDMEFNLAKGVLNVRTSSRLGYTDMGVNAKRFNWFALRLGSTPGWTAPPIRAKGHAEYFSVNGLSEQEALNPKAKL
jgi:hypothetical protein